MDSTTSITGIIVDLEKGEAQVFGQRADGSGVAVSLALTELQLGHLGNGQMAQVTFSDGQKSPKIEPLYVDRSRFSATAPPVMAIAIGAVFLVLAVAVYWWRQKRTRESPRER